MIRSEEEEEEEEENDDDDDDDDDNGSYHSDRNSGVQEATSSFNAPSAKKKFSFPDGIISACHKRNYDVTHSDSKYVAFDAKVDGCVRKIYIYIFENTLEFTIRSKFKYPSKADVPADLVVDALCRNSKSKESYWCIENVNDVYTLERMQNISIFRFDDEWLKIITENLIKRCSELEGEFTCTSPDTELEPQRKNATSSEKELAEEFDDSRPCVRCGEQIKIGVKFCPFCDYTQPY